MWLAILTIKNKVTATNVQLNEDGYASKNLFVLRFLVAIFRTQNCELFEPTIDGFMTRHQPIKFCLLVMWQRFPGERRPSATSVAFISQVVFVGTKSAVQEISRNSKVRPFTT